jgi:glycerol dehydrogenase-like iron-containing ADH family enzyme
MNVWPLPRITFHDLSSVQESRLTALITTPSIWANIKNTLELPIAVQSEPHKIDRDFLETLGAGVPPQIGVIYAIGPDATIDAAKVIAWRSKKPLVIVPTAFSSDTPFCWTASVRDHGEMIDLVTGPAEQVIIDWHVITDAAPTERGAGIADVLAITTALLDWSYAAKNNKTTLDTKIVPWALSIAVGLAQQALKIAPAVGQGNPEALRNLLDLLCLMVQLDSQLGHRRASHGLEHLFADVVKADPTVSHVEKVAAGILYSAALNGQDPQPLRNALEAAGIRCDQLKAADIRAAAVGLNDYAKAHPDLPYSLANDLTDATAIAAALTKSTLLTVPAAAKPASS